MQGAQLPVSVWATRLLQALILVTPGLLLLSPGLVGDSLLGLPGGQTYAQLHALWAGDIIMGFPGHESPASPDRLLSLLPGSPTTAIRLGYLLDLSLSLGFALWFLQKQSPWQNPWLRVVASSALTTSPAVASLLASGEPWALRTWAMTAPALPGLAGLLFAVPAAIFAPHYAIFSPLLLLLQKNTSRQWVAPAISVATAVFLGLPAHDAPMTAWFSRYQAPPDAGSWPAVYVGITSVILLVGAGILTDAGRRLASIAALSFALGALRTPLHPVAALAIFPVLALLAGGLLVEKFQPTSYVAGVILLGALVAGEGWKGSLWPLPTTSLAIPEVLSNLPGPVLDLPATKSACRKSMYWQTAHQQAIACGADGLVAEQVRGVLGDSCPKVQSLGFRSLVVRREAEYRNLEALVACLGAPTRDDGKVAVWVLEP